MERKERLKEVYNYLRNNGLVHTQKGFGDALGKAEGTMSKAFKGDEAYLTDNLLRKICDVFPDIFNIDYLIKGEGELLVSSSNGVPFHPTLRAGVPLVSQYAYAGYMGGYADPEYVESLPHIDFTPDREMTGNYVAFEVRGDSMDDGSKESYIEGEIVICREVEPEYWRDSRLYFNKRDFVVVHQDGILIKRVIAHDVENHLITIHSLNPMYQDKVLDLKDVRQIFSIVESRIQRRR